MPLGPVRFATRCLQWAPGYPISIDQLTMLEEESVCDPRRFFADLRIAPEPLIDGLRRMLAENA